MYVFLCLRTESPLESYCRNTKPELHRPHVEKLELKSLPFNHAYEHENAVLQPFLSFFWCVGGEMLSQLMSSMTFHFLFLTSKSQDREASALHVTLKNTYLVLFLSQSRDGCGQQKRIQFNEPFFVCTSRDDRQMKEWTKALGRDT
jgi:hypothetical protein